jgi:hypothetical protein
LKEGRRKIMTNDTRRRLAILAVVLAALAVATPSAGNARPASPAGPCRLEVIDETGRPLPTFAHEGRTYVLGTLGQRYLIRIRNDGARRVEAVVSVDGRDVVDGQPASWRRRGYLVDAGGEVTIDGFRLSTEAVAAFRFSSVSRSYAALQGDARDVGVIGLAVFAERERPRPAPPALPLRESAPRAKTSRGSADSAGAAGVPPAPQSAEAPTDARADAPERLGLGTEFGEEHGSRVRLVSFERASSRPEAVVVIRYDDREGLLAAGVDVDGVGRARRQEARRREEARPFQGQCAFAEPPRGWRAAR